MGSGKGSVVVGTGSDDAGTGSVAVGTGGSVAGTGVVASCISQDSPENPSGQWQSASPNLESQIPPFKQLTSLHGSSVSSQFSPENP